MRAIISRINELSKQGKKGLAVLLDPDKLENDERLVNLMNLIHRSGADFIFVGGSLLVQTEFESILKRIKQLARIPVIIFPGNPAQVSSDADAILFLSLVSGRNAELLIGQHVVAAPAIRKAGLEVIPTGYMLIDCGKSTTASYISQTFPIPWNKPEIAAVTAMASEMLGHQLIYLDGGSGADKPVSTEMISAVRESVKIPIVVGGGIRNEQQARDAYAAGADIVVVGTAFEEEPELLFELAQSRVA
jgi:putative glycerol-1-phosphate prenyltransferase